MSAFTDVLAAHADFIRRHNGRRACTCGMWESNGNEQYSRDTFAAHVEVELAKAGIAITQLPEATDTYNHEMEMPMMGWEVGHGPHFVEAFPGEIRVEVDGKAVTLTDPPDARELAAALLAAAAAGSIPTKETPNA